MQLHRTSRAEFVCEWGIRTRGPTQGAAKKPKHQATEGDGGESPLQNAPRNGLYTGIAAYDFSAFQLGKFMTPTDQIVT